MDRDYKIPVYFTGKHYAFAFFVFVIWSILILVEDHNLGCPASHGVMYHTSLHLFTLALYMASHAVVIHQVERINKPYEFAISKMGTVLVVLRKLKFYLMVRIILICTWLFMVFYINAEETYVPVIILLAHLLLVITTITGIVSAVKTDNSKLPTHRDKLELSKAFYVASVIEILCSIVWLMFNIADVHLCHEWYEWNISW